jgi:hypothetical protein
MIDFKIDGNFLNYEAKPPLAFGDGPGPDQMAAR